MARKKGVHYVDNAKFLQAMKDWKEQCKDAEEAGDEPPRISDYIGECFLKIANGLSFRPNFINYTYRQEMISDGIENCLQYIHNFNPEKSKNPFAYFTQIIYYAFIRRIQKEKKQTSIKQKLILKSGLDEIVRQEGDNEEYQNAYADFLRKNMVVDIEPEKKETKTKPKKRKITTKLEYFINEDSATE